MIDQSMSSVLFVCTGNLYRSPLAAAFFHKKLEDLGQASRWIVTSAGTEATPERAVPTELVVAAQHYGLDLTDHVARQVDEELLTRHALILVMEKGHKEALNLEFPFVRSKVHLLSEVVDSIPYDISDPVRCGKEPGLFVSEFVRLMERGYRKIWEVAIAMQILGV